MIKWYDSIKGFGVISSLIPKKAETIEVFCHHTQMVGVSKGLPIIFNLRNRRKGGYESVNCVTFTGKPDQWQLIFQNINFNLEVRTDHCTKNVFVEALKTIYTSERAGIFITEYNNTRRGTVMFTDNELLYLTEGLANSSIKEIHSFIQSVTTHFSFKEKIKLLKENKIGAFVFREEECLSSIDEITDSVIEKIIITNNALARKVLEKKIFTVLNNFSFIYYSDMSSVKTYKSEYQKLDDYYELYVRCTNTEERKELLTNVEEIVSRKISFFCAELSALSNRAQDISIFAEKYNALCNFPLFFPATLKDKCIVIAHNYIYRRFELSYIIRLMALKVMPVNHEYINDKKSELQFEDISLLLEKCLIFNKTAVDSLICDYLNRSHDAKNVFSLYIKYIHLQRQEITDKLKSYILEDIEAFDYIGNQLPMCITLFGEEFIYSISTYVIERKHNSWAIYDLLSVVNGNLKEKIIQKLYSLLIEHPEFIDDSFVSTFGELNFSKCLGEHYTDFLLRMLYVYLDNTRNYKNTIQYAISFGSHFKNVIENFFISSISQNEYLQLWEDELCEKLPDGYFDKYLNGEEKNYLKLDVLLSKGRINKDFLVHHINIKLNSISRIKYHRNFKNSFLIYEFILKKGWDIGEFAFDKDQKKYFDMALSMSFSDYNEICSLFLIYPEKIQVKLFKYVFKKISEGIYRIDVDDLQKLYNCIPEYLSYDSDDKPVMGLSISVIIEFLYSYKNNGKFLSDKDFYRLVYKSMGNGYNGLSTIGEFFDKCTGKKRRIYPDTNYITKFIFPIIGTDCKKWYIINFPYDASLILKVKEITGRKYHPKYQVWFAPESSLPDIESFADKNNFLLLHNELSIELIGKPFQSIKDVYDKNQYHYEALKLSELKTSNENMTRIVWCEGTESQLKDEPDVWWCVGHYPCNACALKLHRIEDWEKFTLFDFCKILGFDMHETNIYGHFKGGQYSRFITSINRFNKLLERLKCRECDSILYPTEKNYAINGATVFSCRNATCCQKDKRIYLNHCYTKRCRGVIDSRDSNKCDNGLVICSSCGTCCSNEMFTSRLQRLKDTGAYQQMIKNGHYHIIRDLEYKIQNSLGHRNMNKFFCFKCGAQILENPKDTVCTSCNTHITYHF